jgi:hypothetical protein
MHIVIKKGTDIVKINKSLSRPRPVEGVDTHEFCGVIDLKEDAMTLQKKMRNEWK